MNIPVLEINGNDLNNLIEYLCEYEYLLHQYGAIKLQLNSHSKLALKKRKKIFNHLQSSNERIIPINSNQRIYSIEQSSSSSSCQSLKMMMMMKDEWNAWSRLFDCKNERFILNHSFQLNESFFSSKTSRLYFDLHRLPKQSILRLGGTQFVNQFTPTIKRVHEGGTFFPLTSSPHHLFSFDYHHEGSEHLWYFIPQHQRNRLEEFLRQRSSSVCLDHGKILIDPIMLNESSIEYYRSIQSPNEIIVISSGTLSQSLSFDASWSESILFALPSTIEHHHTDQSSSCQCLRNHSIDMQFFRKEFVQQKTFEEYLQNNHHHHQLINHSQENNPSINSSTNLFKDQTIVHHDDDHLLDFNEQISSQFPSQDKEQQISEENSSSSSWNTFEQMFLDSIWNEQYLSQSSQQTIILDKTNAMLTNLSPISDQTFLSFEQLMDDTLDNQSLSLSCSSQSNSPNSKISSPSPSMNSLDEHQTMSNQSNAHHHHRKYEIFDKRKENASRTLFVSGLKSDISIDLIRQYFPGCLKVTMKRYRTTPNLKYAFIIHRTYREATRNLVRSIDYSNLGCECRIEYADQHSNNQQQQSIVEQNQIVVNQIPENISKDDLSHLFINCSIIKYCPSRYVYFTTTTTNSNDQQTSKFLWGYAILLYDNQQLLNNVIQHAHQYQINGQQLAISLYRNDK